MRAYGFRVKNEAILLPDVRLVVYLDMNEGKPAYARGIESYCKPDRLADMTPCPRTACLYKPGTPMPGVFCSFSYAGKVPCTGRYRCLMCGREKQ